MTLSLEIHTIPFLPLLKCVTDEKLKGQKNMKTLIRLFAILVLTGSAIAGVYKVDYPIHGSGKAITINADSSDDARHKVQDVFPDTVVTGVRKAH